MQVTIKNLTPGVRVFKNFRGQDVIIQPQDSRSFDMHPHHVRQAKREAEKENPKLELIGDPDEIADVDQPGGNMTGEEKAKRILAKRAEEQRLHGLRLQAGLEQPAQQLSEAELELQRQEREPQTFQEAADEPMAQTDPANPENPSRNQRRRYRS